MQALRKMSWSARAFGLNHEQMQFLSWLSLIEQHDVLVQASEQQVKMAVSIWPGLRSRSSLKLFALFEHASLRGQFFLPSGVRWDRI